MKLMPGLWCYAAAAVLLIAVSSAFAQRVTVTRNDGSRLTGELIREGEDEVVLSVSGISTRVPRSDIQNITHELSPQERYRQDVAQLREGDLEGRYRLIYALALEDKLYELAASELARFGEQLPEQEQDLRERVDRLSRVIENRIKMIQQQEEQEQEGQDDPDPEQTSVPTPDAPDPDLPTPQGDPAADAESVREYQRSLARQRVSEEQANLVRVYELDTQLRTPVHVPREVAEAVLREYADNPEVPGGTSGRRRLLAMRDREMVQLLFTLRARELYPMVQVRRDPPSMVEFRKLQRTYVLNYCGTANCHGGMGAGDLQLFQMDPENDRTLYSNFLALDQYESPEGLMIDRQLPERSLLVQYGLPPDEAAVPHPDVEGWNPALLSTNTPQYRMVVNWVESLYSPKPDYGVNWQPPQPADPAQAQGDESAGP